MSSYLTDPRYQPQPQYNPFVGHAAAYGQPWVQPQQPGSLPALARFRTALAQKQQLEATLQSAGTEVRTDISARLQGLIAILKGEANSFLPEEETIRIVHELEHYVSVLMPPPPQSAPIPQQPAQQLVAEPPPPTPPTGG